MKDNIFKPLLAPAEQPDLNNLEYPCYISTKLDGIRICVKDGKIMSRSLKPIPSKQINEKFTLLQDISIKHNIILDGEAYAHGVPFQFLISCVMTEDYNDKSSIKKWEELKKEYNANISRQEVLDKIEFWCFDILTDEQLPFSRRYGDVKYYSIKYPIIKEVEHVLVNSANEINKEFNKVLDLGFEGCMIRSMNGRYKYGRSTFKEKIIYKLKPFVTEDAKITRIQQATEVKEDVEKTITELGYSRTSKLASDRVLVDKANAFVVDYNGMELKIPLAMTNEQKEYVWKNQNEYIGKWVEFCAMKIGVKDLPRIPKYIRMRPDKDE